MKKKVLGIICSMAVTALVLAGCKSETIPAQEQIEAVDTSEASSIVQVMVVETAYGSKGWEQVTEAFTAETGIEVQLTVDKNVEEMLDNALQQGGEPDVVHLPTGRQAGITEQFIKKKMLENITDVMFMDIPGEEEVVCEKIAGGFIDTSLTNPYDDGNTYLAPMFYAPCGLFYNAGLLEEKGWEIPTTWDEMWKLGEKAKEEGIALFTYPTAGYFDSFFYALLYSVGGPDFFYAVTTYEEGIWDTEEGKVCLEILVKLASYTHQNTVSQANNDDFIKNQQLILENEAIFMPNGTWVVEEMANAQKADGFAWGMIPIPAMKEGEDCYSYARFEQVWIPKNAKNIEGAKLFISFLYSDVACEIFAENGAVQPVLGIGEYLEDENVMMYSVYDNGAKAVLGDFASFTADAGLNVGTVFFEPMNEIVSGSLTTEEWKAKISKANDLMRKYLIQ